MVVAGDICHAFLQVRIQETERDALQFHWIADKTAKQVETLHFTRVVFGLAPSPFLLNGKIQQHLESLLSTYPDAVKEILKSPYMDDLLSGEPSIGKAKQLKQEAIEIFADAKFELHKWHLNRKELETTCEDYKPSFAKEQLENTLVKGEYKLLGIVWDKAKDTLHVCFPATPAEQTKCGTLTNLVKVYDPLGIVSPAMLEGKVLYRESCTEKKAWDAPLSEETMKKWKKWERSLPEAVSVRRSIPLYQEEIDENQLHAFGDASGRGACAAVYAMVKQASGIPQGLVPAKSHLTKQRLTVPWLALGSGHRAENLITNVLQALEGLALVAKDYCWSDRSVALHWIADKGEYRQFVQNCVTRIQSHPNVLWRHVSSIDNPANLGSHGGSLVGAELWWDGPAWLSEPVKWPDDIMLGPSPESMAE